MNDTSSSGRSVFARANALMQQRRQSESPVEAEPPVLTETLTEEDDLPVLTEIAESDDAAVAETPLPATLPATVIAPPAFDPQQFDRLAQDLTRHVHDRLAVELPSLVEAALQSVLPELTRELENGLGEIAEEAIRDFLAEHGQR